MDYYIKSVFNFVSYTVSNFRIQNLSLRNCYVNDMGAKMIGRALTANKSLTTLNLCYNKITCEGAALIAKVPIKIHFVHILVTYSLTESLSFSRDAIFSGDLKLSGDFLSHVCYLLPQYQTTWWPLSPRKLPKFDPPSQTITNFTPPILQPFDV